MCPLIRPKTEDTGFHVLVKVRSLVRHLPPILWPHDAKSQPTGKGPDAGRDWGQEEKGTPEDETAGWHHRLSGYTYIHPMEYFRQVMHLVAFPLASDGQESACTAADPGSIPGSGRSPGEVNSYPLWYSCLENPMDRGAWWATVPGVAKTQKWLSD